MDPLQVVITLTPNPQGASMNVGSNRPLEPNVLLQILADAIKAIASQQPSTNPTPVIEIANRMPPVANGWKH